MQSQSRKPLLIYDNACDFCRYWIAQWQHVTGDRVDYAPSQEVATQFPEIPLSAFENSVQLILQNGTVLSGAEAVLRALNNGSFLWCYYRLPGFEHVRRNLPFHCTAPSVFLRGDTMVVGDTHGANNLLLFKMAISTRTRLYLPHRFFVPVGADSRTHWKQWNFTSRTVFGSCPSANRNRRLLLRSDVVLAESFRHFPSLFVCWWCSAVLSLNRGLLPNFHFSRLMGILSVACDSWASVSQLPVGCPALRGRIFGNLLRAAATT